MSCTTPELVVGIQDLGGAGLTCALTETAAAAGTGMRVWLERVPLREPSMEPHEILASESQERMLLVVAPEQARRRCSTIAEKWGVLATAIGEVTPPAADGRPGRLLITWHDQTWSSTCRRARWSTTVRSTPGRCASRPT